MKCGKLPNDVLEDIVISSIKKKNKDIFVGPKVGEDCSIVDFDNEVLVLTTDPVTAAQNDAGKIGIHICCNDIASAGVSPLGVLVTILAPPSSTIDDIKRIMNEINETCEELNIDVLGGHTEVTDAVNRIVLSITAIGKSRGKRYVTTGGAKTGDDVIITGNVAAEGTAIIAKDYYEKLKVKINEEILLKAQNLIKDISVVKAGLIAGEFGVNAMHDATEGGVLGAIWEVAQSSGKGVYVYEDKIAIKEETKIICDTLNLDPLRLISSGCMIITCKNGEELIKRLNEHKIEACIAGKITDEEKIILSKGEEKELSPPDSDEIYRVNI
ncbi:Hydrogenase maturation factor [Caloramator quimbayensis]|uniref:Hydrogenase maturation factor n=1 Tax=Caloramator quimbayensis TaxID=1147123 RepID=A0A1T4XKB6_9CLOT|nr:AIR synthase family protein [Caloramator quimbayensis]SKA90019.1 Hydrogenase maturation factor [Caloramator quimbayensis]